MKKGIWAIIIIAALIYSGLCAIMYFRQEALIFFPTRQIREVQLPEGVTTVKIPTSDGLTLSGFYLNSDSDKTVLFFHGNAGNISSRLSRLEFFRELGLNALMFDYRGYGASEGRIRKEADLYLDAEATLEYLHAERGVADENLIIWGRSLGGAIAIDTAAKNKNIAKLIAESTFTSIPDVAARFYPLLPVRLLSRYQFASVDKVSAISVPTLIIHSSDDRTIPISHGRELHNVFPTSKFVESSGTHNRGFYENKKKYGEAITSFLEL